MAVLLEKSEKLIEEAYNTYKKALNIDPNNRAALDGISRTKAFVERQHYRD